MWRRLQGISRIVQYAALPRCICFHSEGRSLAGLFKSDNLRRNWMDAKRRNTSNASRYIATTNVLRLISDCI